MSKVTVHRARRWNSETQDYYVLTRMFTREAIDASNTLELVAGTEAEIDAHQLVPGEGWTAENFHPRNSMDDRYTVKWSVGVDEYPFEPFSTQQEALGRVRELFVIHDQKLHVEIYLNDTVYLGFRTLSQWNKGLLSLS